MLISIVSTISHFMATDLPAVCSGLPPDSCADHQQQEEGHRGVDGPATAPYRRPKRRRWLSREDSALAVRLRSRCSRPRCLDASVSAALVAAATLAFATTLLRCVRRCGRERKRLRRPESDAAQGATGLGSGHGTAAGQRGSGADSTRGPERERAAAARERAFVGHFDHVGERCAGLRRDGRRRHFDREIHRFTRRRRARGGVVPGILSRSPRGHVRERSIIAAGGV